MYTVYVLHVSQSFVKGGRSSVWGGVDSYSASQLIDTLSLRLSLRPLTLGKLAASCKWLVVHVPFDILLCINGCTAYIPAKLPFAKRGRYTVSNELSLRNVSIK